MPISTEYPRRISSRDCHFVLPVNMFLKSFIKISTVYHKTLISSIENRHFFESVGMVGKLKIWYNFIRFVGNV